MKKDQIVITPEGYLAKVLSTDWVSESITICRDQDGLLIDKIVDMIIIDTCNLHDGAIYGWYEFDLEILEVWMTA